MSMSSVPEPILYQWLANAGKLLNAMDLKLSSITVNNIQNQIKTETPKINYSELNKKFRDLQDTVEVEFSKRGLHSQNVLVQLQKAVRVTISKNLQESQKTFEVNSVMETWEKRRKSYLICEKLRQIVLRSKPDEEERLIGISFAYLGLVNGVFRLALQDCYAWQRLSKGGSINSNWLKRQEIHDMHRYFKDNFLPLYYFYGWDSIVRNAVGHSNFYYDGTTQKMTYINEPNDPAKFSVSEYDFLQMVENVEQMLTVYHADLLMMQTLLVSSCCTEFAKRYP